MAKIFSRDEYLQALRVDDEKKSLRGTTAGACRNAVCASTGKGPAAESRMAANERSGRRRKAYRHLDAYAGQFY
jgi:hypothetical protein